MKNGSVIGVDEYEEQRGTRCPEGDGSVPVKVERNQ